MRIDRRTWIALIGVLVIAGGVLLWQTVFHKPSEECRPVRELLEFNSSEAKVISDKTGDGALPIADYQMWADGLTQRAGHVSKPELATHAVRVAELATQFVTVLPQVQAAPAGQKAPPAAYRMAALNDQINAEMKQLSDACPD